MLPTIFIVLSVLGIFPTKLIGTQAYPITSKPIEGTAENWAWQPWVRQTSEEQSKGKARKVTPKSVFEIPYRQNCPDGFHLDGFRCIPTLSVDDEMLLNQQALALVSDVSIGNNYQFDYEEEDGSTNADGLGSETAFNSYDDVQKFSILSTSFDNSAQLPSQDAPLKFNFFEQKLSSNDNETMPVTMFLEEEENVSAVVNTTNASDGQLNQTQVAKVHMFLNSNTNNTNNTNITTVVSSNATMANNGFSLNNIDAISLTATVPLKVNLSLPQQTVNSTQQISLYKGDNAVQLITSTLVNEPITTTTTEEQESLHMELKRLLMAEDLLLLPVDNTKQLINETTKKDTTSIELDRFNEEYPEDMPSVETQINKEKTDHTRSVPDGLLIPVEALTAQEDELTTTLEPDTTTSFQLDDTTIIEAFNPPTIELQELKVKHARESSRGEIQEQSVLEKKSKVEPVAQLSVDHKLIMTTATTTDTTTIAPLPTIPTHKSEIIDDDVDVYIGAGANQFSYIDVDNVDTVANFMNISTTQIDADTDTNTQTETTATTESATIIKSQTESRIINKLVKGENIKIRTSSSSSPTDSIAYTTTPTTTSNENNLKNIEMEIVTSKNAVTTGSAVHAHHDNNNKESLLTNADVVDNHNIDTSEIVFVVENKKQLPTKAVESMESFITTTTTTIKPKAYKETKEKTEAEKETVKQSPSTSATEIETTQKTTSKRWSKVMPLFESDTTRTTSFKMDENLYNTNVDVEEVEPISITTEMMVSQKTSSINISEKRKSSRRNSKIIHLDKYPLAISVNSLSEPPPITTTSETTETEATETATAETTTIRNDATQNDKVTVNKRSQTDLDPFWWLPTNWHLDRHADVEGRPLFMRLWTAFTSDTQAKM